MHLLAFEDHFGTNASLKSLGDVIGHTNLSWCAFNICLCVINETTSFAQDFSALTLLSIRTFLVHLQISSLRTHKVPDPS